MESWILNQTWNHHKTWTRAKGDYHCVHHCLHLYTTLNSFPNSNLQVPCNIFGDFFNFLMNLEYFQRFLWESHSPVGLYKHSRSLMSREYHWYDNNYAYLIWPIVHQEPSNLSVPKPSQAHQWNLNPPPSNSGTDMLSHCAILPTRRFIFHIPLTPMTRLQWQDANGEATFMVRLQTCNL